MGQGERDKGKGYDPRPKHALLSFVFSTKTFRSRLIRCNGYYTVIDISIIRNKRNCNVITITIHMFGDNI